MLFSVGGMFSIYEGWHKLGDSQPVERPFVALGVLLFGICAESFSMWGALREVNKLRGDASLWRWFRVSRNAELVVIFGEDLAALVGLVLAFVAILVAWATGNPVWDALGSIAIGVLLIVVAVAVAIEVKALLVGQGVEPQVREAMMAFLRAQPAVDEVLNLLTLHLGADVMVAIKARMRPQGGEEALVAINGVELAFRKDSQVQWSSSSGRARTRGRRLIHRRRGAAHRAARSAHPVISVTAGLRA